MGVFVMESCSRNFLGEIKFEIYSAFPLRDACSIRFLYLYLPVVPVVPVVLLFVFVWMSLIRILLPAPSWVGLVVEAVVSKAANSLSCSAFLFCFSLLRWSFNLLSSSFSCNNLARACVQNSKIDETH